MVVGIGVLIGLVAALARRESGAERLEVRCINRAFEDLERSVRHEVLPAKRFKAEEKARKKAEKARAKRHPHAERKRIFVLNFRGDIKASAVASLRQEVTAVLAVAQRSDEVLLRLENAGGLVHEHGLAASQLLRLRERSIPLTVAVDKVAASGGYMMACVADRVLAAPFAILGSIGVLLQLPNFRRMLDSGGVDFEQIKGGEFKRTLTLFGPNTEAERSAAQAQVDDTHALFKEFVSEYRPGPSHRARRHGGALARQARPRARALRRAHHQRRLPARGEQERRSLRIALRDQEEPGRGSSWLPPAPPWSSSPRASLPAIRPGPGDPARDGLRGRNSLSWPRYRRL